MTINSLTTLAPLSRAHPGLTQPLVDQHSLSRHRRETPVLPEPIGETRAEGDKALAALYGQALRKTIGTHDEVMIDNIPPNSTFGQWWSQLGRAMQSSEINDWMRDKHVDKDTLSMNPTTGQITFKAQRHRGPNLTVQRGDDEGWEAVNEHVKAAGKVLAAGYQHSTSTFRPPLSESSNSAPLWLVKRFYREPEESSHDLIEQRATQLIQERAFVDLPIDTFSWLHEPRSEQALEHQQVILANSTNQRTAILSLKHLLTLMESGGVTDEMILDHLKADQLQVEIDSTYPRDKLNKWGETSLHHYLAENGWDIPRNQPQVKNLLTALLSLKLKGPPHGNYGGALAWPIPLDSISQSQLRASIRQGKIGDVDLDHSKSVLEYLMQGTALEPSELHHPRRVLDRVVQSNRAAALGDAIKARFEAESVEGSASDWLLAALSADKEDVVPATKAALKALVAGYPLTGEDNYGKSARAIFDGLTAHLESTDRASPEQSKILAHLLLSTRAPELLVEGIPEKVTFGSHSWVTFVTAVERLEAKAPGSTASMTYAQIMLSAEVAPISREERLTEFMAQQDALKHWGLANGLPYPVSDVQMNNVRRAFNSQLRELKAASEAQNAPVPEARAIALDALKQALPHMDPALFEKKCLTLEPSVQDFPGPYSVLDLHMDGRPASGTPTAYYDSLYRFFHPSADSSSTSRFISSSTDININEVLNVIKRLPSVSDQFKKGFLAWSDALSKSITVQVRQMISQLPLEDRKNLEFGEITIAKEMDIPKLATRTERRVKEKSLLIKTQRAGVINTYELDLKSGEVSKREGNSKHFKPDPKFGTIPLREERKIKYRRDYDLVTPKGNYTPGLTHEKKETSLIPDSFNSERTNYIADAMLQDADIDALKKEAQGLTSFDTEVPFYKKLKEFMLNLIPFKSAIDNFQQGNIGAGTVDLALDVFGFLCAGFAAAKGAKALSTAASVLTKTLHSGKILGRTVIGAINPLDGIGDVAKGGARLISNGMDYLGGTVRKADLFSLAKRTDIAEVSVKSAGGVSSYRTLAKVDNRTGKVYRYSAKADKVYGRPLEGFSLNPAGANDRHSLLGRQLMADNLVDMGGPMRELKALNKEIFSFVDNVQSTSRLTIVAHGWERSTLKKLFNSGSTIADSANNSYSPKQFLELLGKHNIDPQKYDSIRFISCFSGEGGTHSFAAKFRELTGKPVAAFEGSVSVRLNDLEQPFRDNINIIKIKNPGLDEPSVYTLAEQKLKKDFEHKFDRVIQLESQHKKVEYVRDGNSSTKTRKDTINYRPTFDGKKPWNAAG